MKISNAIDYAITSGTRTLGRILSKGEKFEPRTADGRPLDLCSSVREAQTALVRADVDQHELDRLADEGGRAE